MQKRKGRVELVGFGRWEPGPHEIETVDDYLKRTGFADIIRPDTRDSVGIIKRAISQTPLIGMAHQASVAAILDACKRLGRFDRLQIDAIIGGGSSPDWIMPTVAARLQSLLGLPAGATHGGFDISAACCSWPAAIMAMHGLMVSGHENIRYGLVCIPDRTASQAASDKCKHSFLWGDGAAATIMAFNPDGDPNAGIVGSSSGVFGQYADWIVSRGVGASSEAQSEEPNIDLGDHGGDIQRFVLEHLPPHIRGYIQSRGRDVTDETFLLPHNANNKMVNGVGKRLGIPPERVLTCLRDRGNTSGASIGITLAQNANRFQSCDQLILAGFGAGMTVQVIYYVWP